MYINIYGIVHPTTKEVVYVGQTPDNLEHYLKTKYWKLNEVKRGNRNWTKLFHFLDDLLPLKAEIVSLYVSDTNKPFDGANFWEKFYINKYRKINPNLLNETDGGIGGNTYRYKTKDEIKNIGQKVSKKLKGRKKPEGFGKKLSELRTGLNNPMAKQLNPRIVAMDNFRIVATFDYGFEINQFVNNNSAYGNISKRLKNGFCNSYGYIWKYE